MESQMPLMPEPGSDGCRPVVESFRVVMAQQLMADRQKAWLSQAELASRVGIRQEAISRIDSGMVEPWFVPWKQLTKH